jgi:hypothetical protein
MWFQHVQDWFLHAECDFDTYVCNYDTQECDNDTLECVFCTQSVISTCIVILICHECDYDTHMSDQGSHLSESKYTEKITKKDKVDKRSGNEEHWNFGRTFYSWPRGWDLGSLWWKYTSIFIGIQFKFISILKY